MLLTFLLSICVVSVSSHELSLEDGVEFYDDNDDNFSLDTAEVLVQKMQNIAKLKHPKLLEMLYGYNDTTTRSSKIVEVMYGYNDTKTTKAEESNTIKPSDRRNQDIRSKKELLYDDRETLIDYPYSASVKRKGSHYATGALINKRWVITVAAEFYNVRESMKLFRVVLGSVDCKKGGSEFPLKSIEIHPLYAPGSPAHDLALLRIAWPVVNTLVIKPIPVAVSEDGQVVDAKFLTTYWPRIVVNNKVLPPNASERIKSTSMRSSTQSLIPPGDCARTMENFKVTLGVGNLCLVPITLYHSKCMPDAGAPMVAKGKLWGVTSGWTPSECATLPGVHPAPTVFTRIDVPSVRLWIDTHLLP